MADALLIGLSGLQAHQRAIEVISHNIANATTPGYTREQVDLAANLPENLPLGQVGRGVQVQDIRRLANSLLIDRLRQAQSEDGRLGQLSDTLQTAQGAFNEPGDNGLSAVINQMFASFDDLAANPESTALRSTTVAQLGTFTSTLNDLGDRLQNLRDDLRGSLESEVAEVNQLTSHISSLNQQIRDQTLIGANPNDLLDQRDQLVSDLSKHLDLRVRPASDGSVLIDSGGTLLVARDYSEQLSVGSTPAGDLSLLASNKVGITASGGSIGALFELHRDVLPGLIDNLDQMTSTLTLEMNARQSTGTNHTFRAGQFTAEATIDAAKSAENLDAADQAQASGGGLGVPKAFLPSFTDANGNPVARNLTINVYDPATDTAQKYTLRYDPATGGGVRSLDDLVSTINSGRSTQAGGFTLYPPSAGGVAGVVAKKVPVDGGYKLELIAQAGKSIDFSAALDTQPTAGAWTSGATTVTGSDATLAGKRLVFQVVGSSLQAYTRSPVDGSQSPYGTPLLLGGAAGTIGGLNLALTAGAGNYHDGESFAVDFDSTGAISGGSHSEIPAWTSGDASMSVRGRYTGEVTFTPGTQWSMRVITPGTIGSSTNAPLVQFTYYTGTKDAPVQQTVQKLLDDSTPAGTPVQIADGVYVQFGQGTLSTAGNQLGFTVDAEPDQARLLPALGINTLFSGSTASTVRVSSQLLADPNRLAVGSTRAAGDNSNLIDMSSVRQAKLFDDGGTSIDDFYQSSITGLGVKIEQTTRLKDNQEALKTSLENQRQQTSGVSIDEEVAGLILQQQAYTAAARIITTQRDNINTLLQMVQ
jgi:flagellar hook-associated protein 1 FlgK